MKFNLHNMFKVSEHNYIKKISNIALGTTISQLVNFVFLILLSNIYLPQQFAAYGFFVSISLILAPILTLRYEYSIPLVEQKHIQIMITNVILTIIFVSIFLVLLCKYIFSFNIGLPEISLSLLMISIIGLGIFNTLHYVCIAKQYFTILSCLFIFRAAVIGFIQILLIYAFNDTTGLITGYAVGNIISSAIFIVLIISKHKILNFTWENNKFFLKKFINFPLYNMPSALIGITASNLLILMLPMIYSDEEAGMYFFILKIVAAPTALLSVAIGSVFYKNAADAYLESRSAKKVLDKFSIFLFIFGMVCFSILTLLMSPIIRNIFSEQWFPSIEYGYIILPLIFIQFVVSPLTQINNIFEKQKLALIWQIALLINNILLLYVSKFLGLTFTEFLYLATVITSLLYLLLYLSIRKVARG